MNSASVPCILGVLQFLCIPYTGLFACFLDKVCVYILCNAVSVIAYGCTLLCMAVCMYGECLPHFAWVYIHCVIDTNTPNVIFS